MPDTIAAEPPQTVVRPVRAMDSGLAKGVMWTGGVKWATQLLSWPLTILTAKLLSPSDYGYLAVVTVITRFMLMVTEAGIGSAIVVGPQVSDGELRQLHSFSALAATGAFAAVMLVSIPISMYTADSSVVGVLALLGFSIILEGVTVVPLSVLRRSLDFRTTALADGFRALTDLSVTLLLAMAGARYWSLVLGYLSGIVVSTIFVRWKCRVSFARPVLTTIGPTLRFSRPLLVRNIASFVAYSGDAALGKLSMTRAALGHYSLAFTVACAPGDKITQIILRVVPSILGNVRESKAELTRYFLAVTSVIALVTMPMFGGIAFVASDLVPLVLGDQWSPMVAVIIPLCLFGAITEVFAMVAHVLQALGESKVLMRNGVFALFLMPVSFFVLSSRFGGPGLAYAWVLGAVFLSLRPLQVACRSLNLPLRRFGAAIIAPLLATTAMLALLLSLRSSHLLDDLGPGARVALEIAAGALTYVAVVFALAHTWLFNLWKIAKHLYQSRGAGPVSGAVGA